MVTMSMICSSSTPAARVHPAVNTHSARSHSAHPRCGQHSHLQRTARWYTGSVRPAHPLIHSPHPVANPPAAAWRGGTPAACAQTRPPPPASASAAEPQPASSSARGCGREGSGGDKEAHALGVSTQEGRGTGTAAELQPASSSARSCGGRGGGQEAQVREVSAGQWAWAWRWQPVTARSHLMPVSVHAQSRGPRRAARPPVHQTCTPRALPRMYLLHTTPPLASPSPRVPSSDRPTADPPVHAVQEAVRLRHVHGAQAHPFTTTR